MDWSASTKIKETRRAEQSDVDLSKGEVRSPLAVGRRSWTVIKLSHDTILSTT